MVGIDFILETHSTEYTWQAFRVVNAFKQRCIMVIMRYPRQQSSWDQHGAHLGPAGPILAPWTLLSGILSFALSIECMMAMIAVESSRDTLRPEKKPTFWQSISSNVNHWLTIISTIMQFYSPYARCVVLLTTFTLEVPRIREPFQKQVRLY